MDTSESNPMRGTPITHCSTNLMFGALARLRLSGDGPHCTAWERQMPVPVTSVAVIAPLRAGCKPSVPLRPRAYRAKTPPMVKLTFARQRAEAVSWPSSPHRLPSYLRRIYKNGASAADVSRFLAFNRLHDGHVLIVPRSVLMLPFSNAWPRLQYQRSCQACAGGSRIPSSRCP
jgi:hypothetical protein